jgi:hypothetical protein
VSCQSVTFWPHCRWWFKPLKFWHCVISWLLPASVKDCNVCLFMVKGLLDPVKRRNLLAEL